LLPKQMAKLGKVDSCQLLGPSNPLSRVRRIGPCPSLLPTVYSCKSIRCTQGDFQSLTGFLGSETAKNLDLNRQIPAGGLKWRENCHISENEATR
jgi:hypothetical protein